MSDEVLFYQAPTTTDTRIAALDLLATLGPSGAPAVPKVLTALERDPGLERTVLSTLPYIGVGDGRVVRAIASRIDSGATNEPERAVDSLVAVSATPEQRALLEDTVTHAVESSPARMLPAALKALRSLEEFQHPAALADLLAPYGAAADARLAERIDVFLARLGDPGVSALASILDSGDRPGVEAACRVVAQTKLRDDRILTRAFALLASAPAPQTRSAAISVLSCTASRDDRLFTALGAAARADESPNVRIAALWALHQTSPGEVARAAAERALDDADPQVRGAGIGILCFLWPTDRAAAEIVTRACSHADAAVAELARRETARMARPQPEGNAEPDR